MLEVVERYPLMVADRPLGNACRPRGEVRVQPLHVHRVDRVLHDLDPVARNLNVLDVADHVVHHEEVPARQQRRRLRPEVGKDQAAQLLDSVRGQPDRVLEPHSGEALRVANLFERLLDATARRVVHPAVVGAADALLLGDAIGQANAPVRARALQQPEAALEVSEQDEVLPEKPHLLRPARDGCPTPLGCRGRSRRRSGTSTCGETPPWACPVRSVSALRLSSALSIWPPPANVTATSNR